MKISVLKSHNQVSNYFSSYYADKQETEHKLQWGGELAKEFGLEGEVEKETFTEMLKGNMPTNEHVSSRKRVGYDLTYSLDKSVSCLIAYSDNEKLKNDLLNAFKEEHKKSMSELEKDICEQRWNSEDKTNSFKKTGNCAYASVLHPTNRLGEPQFHMHTVLINATRNGEGKLKAVELEGLAYKSGLAHEQIRKRIENVLHEANISTTRDLKTGEIVINGLDKEFLDSKSTRSRQIETYLQKNFGLSYAEATEKQRETAALKSRATKKEESVEKAMERFKGDLKAREIVDKALTTKTHEKSLKGAKEAVSFATEKLIEREGAFGTHKLIVEASRAAGANVTLEEIKEEIKTRIEKGDLIKGHNEKKSWLPEFVTTQKQLDREKNIKDFVMSGRDKEKQVLDKFELASFLEKNATFSEEQKKAATLLLTNTDRVIAVQGVAGAGKTYLMSPVIEEMQSKGYSVVGLGPSWASVDAMKEAGAEGKTLQGFVSNAKNREGLKQGKTIIMLDEASLADTKNLESLCAIAKKNNYRLVLQGDSRQLESVESGGMFNYLQKSEALETARIETSMRQKDADKAMREAVLLARDNPEESIKRLQDMKKLQQTNNPKTMAKEKFFEDKNTLLLTNTNSLKNSINNEVKQELVKRGELKNGFEIKTFKSHNLTEVEKQEAKAGQHFKAQRDYKRLGIEKGEVFEIVQNERGKLALKNDTKHIVFDARRNKNFEIGEVKKEMFYEGEKIELNTNDYLKNGLKNRDNVFIEKIENGKLHFKKNDNAKVLEMSIENNKATDISSGYAKTVHSSQGLSVDKAVFFADSRVDNRSFMVAATRIKKDLEVFTDNIDQLKNSVKFTQYKQVALEVADKTIEKERTKIMPEKQVEQPKPQVKTTPVKTSTPKLGLGISFFDLFKEAQKEEKEEEKPKKSYEGPSYGR